MLLSLFLRLISALLSASAGIGSFPPVQERRFWRANDRVLTEKSLFGLLVVRQLSYYDLLTT